MKIADRVTITSYDDDGRRIDYRETYRPESFMHRVRKLLGLDNKFCIDLILDSGLADVVSLIKDRYNYISVGTGATQPSNTDTGLESEILTRGYATKSIKTTFFTNDTAEFRAGFLPDANYMITESGVHKNETSVDDIVFARETFPPYQFIKDVETDVAWEIIVMR